MSLPIEAAKIAAERLLSGRPQNIIAQTDARHILQEVREHEDNYPRFDPRLTEKATHIAYALIACGCSIVENGDSITNTTEGLSYLEKAGKILYDTYKYNPHEEDNKNYSLLIAGMALFAAKQYSRAFITLNDIDIDFSVGQIITSFIKKDFAALMKETNEVFFSPIPEEQDIRSLDEWIIAHEIARCFMIISDYIYSGNTAAFSAIDEILQKLLGVATEDNLTLYWLILRLLRILFDTYENASLWAVLPPRLPSGRLLESYIRLLGSFGSPVTELWTSQTTALDMALGDNSGAVINLRTSGGKTRVAELAILQALIDDPSSKVLYLAPFRSLAFEIEHSLNKTFTPLGFSITHLYGNATVNLSDFDLVQASNIIIATPEKAKALIRGGSGIETDIKLIIIDEGHLLGANERLLRIEMFLTHIKAYAARQNIRVVLLSAVLPNAEDLAKWVAGDTALVARSDWKPSLERRGLLIWNGTSVRLNWYGDEAPFNPNFVQKKPLGFGRRVKEFPNDKAEAVAATAVRLAQNGTVMIFSARANSIEGLAKAVLLALGNNPADYDWDKSAWDVFESVCAEELGQSTVVLKAARKGVICHNNRLPTLVRIAIERLMRSRPPLIVIASTTLGQGVNIGISTVIVHTPYFSNETISNRDFWNVCGRAGRAYSDAEGKILYVVDNTREKWQVNQDKRLIRKYYNGQIENVRSGLLAALKEILKISVRAKVSFEILLEAIANDFNQLELPSAAVTGMRYLFDLIDDELLAMHEDFAGEADDIDWVDDLFRQSLAIIQADTDKQEQLIQMLQARVKGIKTRVADKTIRRQIIATGVPFSVAREIQKDTDFFRSLAENFILERDSDFQEIETVSKYIGKIEEWVFTKANSLLDEKIPSQEVFESIRHDWIAGVELAIISSRVPQASDAIKYCYDFTLPWIIHAISRLFDPETDEEICRAYSLLAMLIELGLPTESAANVYLAGVRSRRASIEIAELECIKGKSIVEIKSILVDFPLAETSISDYSKVWIDSISNLYDEQRQRSISFPAFTLKREEVPDILYMRENAGKFYLVSADGEFILEVMSTKDLPFHTIAGRRGLYFEFIKKAWRLRSYNPQILVK